jgi:DNA invertase Pin-like site-specific DNA recombinase
MLIGYARVSTARQDVALQTDALKALGCEKVFIDHGLSGKNRERPQLQAALASLREGDTLVATKLDRLARSTQDALAIAQEVLAAGASLRADTMSFGGDPAGNLTYAVLAAVAEFERALIRSRTQAGVDKAKAAGKMTGGKPKLSEQQEARLMRAYQYEDTSIANLCEDFDISKPTLYRIMARRGITPASRS